MHSFSSNPVAAPALKNPREMGGGGILTYFFNLKVYPTNSKPFFFDNFCRLLGFEGGGGTNPPVPPPPVAPPLLKSSKTSHFWSFRSQKFRQQSKIFRQMVSWGDAPPLNPFFASALQVSSSSTSRDCIAYR